MKHEDIARICHEVIRAFSCAIGEDIESDWCSTPWCVKYLLGDTITYYVENPAAGPKVWHDAWVFAMVMDGWTYGDCNCDLRTHPWIMAFDELDVLQQAKIYIIREIVFCLLEFVDTGKSGDGGSEWIN